MQSRRHAARPQRFAHGAPVRSERLLSRDRRLLVASPSLSLSATTWRRGHRRASHWEFLAALLEGRPDGVACATASHARADFQVTRNADRHHWLSSARKNLTRTAQIDQAASFALHCGISWPRGRASLLGAVLSFKDFQDDARPTERRKHQHRDDAPQHKAAEREGCGIRAIYCLTHAQQTYRAAML